MGVEGGLMFNPKSIAKKFDEFLDNNGLRFFGVVIGGAALVLLDIIDRSTKDFDILEDQIPDDIKEAAVRFAA
jgi:Nucleotidyltransferase of unknown function (DUF6036)